MFEFVKGNKKIIYIIIITIVLFIAISYLINSCTHSVISGLTNENESENIKKLSMYKEYEAGEVLAGIAKKNGDWSIYPLSKKFLSKYNSVDGIFPQYAFEDIGWNGMKRDKYNKETKEGSFWYNLYVPINRPLDIVGPAWDVEIKYYLNNNGELDDFEIVSEKQVYDEKGYPIREWDKEFTYKNLYLISDPLFYDHNCGWYANFLEPRMIEKEPCSKRFIEKVLNKDKNKKGRYIDFFPEIEYSFGRFYYDKGVSIEESVKNKKLYAVCQVYRDDADPVYSDDLPEKNYLYQVHFALDDENQLDDVWVDYIGEISNEELAKRYD